MSFKGVCKELNVKIIIPLFLDFDTLKEELFTFILVAINGSKHVKFLQILVTF